MEEHDCVRTMSGKDRNLGVFVKSWSGSSSECICSLGGRDDVKHMVSVTNLEVYSLDVECSGRISSNPQKARFSCASSPRVTNSSWTATAEDIEMEGGDHFFDHVKLMCTELSGTERVHTTLKCSWLDKEGELPTFAFSVTT